VKATPRDAAENVIEDRYIARGGTVGKGGAARFVPPYFVPPVFPAPVFPVLALPVLGTYLAAAHASTRCTIDRYGNPACSDSPISHVRLVEKPAAQPGGNPCFRRRKA